MPLERFVGVLLDEILSSNLDQHAYHLIQHFIALVLLVVCSVAINLIHANLIRFERIDQLRVLSRLTMNFVCLVVSFAIAAVNFPSAGIVMFTFCVSIFRVLSHLLLSVRNCSLEGVHDILRLGLGLAEVLRLFWSLEIRCHGPIQHHGVIFWAVSTLMSKVFIEALSRRECLVRPTLLADVSPCRLTSG